MRYIKYVNNFTIFYHMARSLSVLSKNLGLTASSNPNERRAAEEKLEQQLQARGITREQLEQQLDMSTVDEEIEAISFRYGQPYKRVDPAVSILLSAVCHYYNGKVVFTNTDEDERYLDNNMRQMEVSANKSRRIEIEVYTDYLVQALQDDWLKHCQEDPFQVAMMGSAHRNSFRKAWANKVWSRFAQMKRDEESNGREIQTESRTINQSALAVTKSNKTELAVVEEYYRKKFTSLSRGRGYTSGGSGSSAGRAAGGNVGLSRQMGSGGYKALGGS